MDGTHEARCAVDNLPDTHVNDGDGLQQDGSHGEGADASCFVLMNSREYGTEVWPCASLDEAVETLARLARSAEQRRREDGIQRYFCILAEPPEESQGAVCDPASPTAPDTDALTLTLHFRQPPGLCWEPDEVPCLRRFAREVEEVAS